LVATKDGCPEAMVLPPPPNEALVVNVARCLNAGSMIEQANSVLVEAACGVISYDREEGNVEGFVWCCT